MGNKTCTINVFERCFEINRAIKISHKYPKTIITCNFSCLVLATVTVANKLFKSCHRHLHRPKGSTLIKKGKSLPSAMANLFRSNSLFFFKEAKKSIIRKLEKFCLCSTRTRDSPPMRVLCYQGIFLLGIIQTPCVLVAV